jgi:Flp pilus assembly protein TadG
MDLSIFKLSPLGKGKREQRGQGVVEFALVLPLLALLVAGAVDLGNGYQTYIAMTNAAREGAHYGINSGDSTAICQHVLQAIPAEPSATCNSGNVYYAVNSDGSCASGGTRAAGSPVCVSINYSLPTFMGAVLGFNTIPLRAAATMIVFNP